MLASDYEINRPNPVIYAIGETHETNPCIIRSRLLTETVYPIEPDSLVQDMG